MIDEALYWDKEAFTKHLTAYFPAAMYWKNAQSVFLGCNAAFAELVGLQAPQEIAGLTDYNLPRGKIFQNPDLVPDNQIILDEEMFMLNSSPLLFHGKTRYFNIRKIPLFDKQRHVFGLLGIYNDVTRIERLKAQLKKQKIKRKAAETTNRAKSEFLQNMRHDVRTPLTGILGFAHIIKEIAETEEMQEYADSIAVSANALLNLMNDVLDAGKVNSDELPIVHKKFDLYYTLQQALDLYLVKADYKRLQLKLDYDANLPRYVMGDPVRIHRIALELISIQWY
jgi:two-component system, OmpR family, aerobic respiration control sensor histidine kinase ArcB